MSSARTKLIKQLDQLHSLVVRQLAANSLGCVECYTCWKWLGMHAATCGHLWSRNAKSIRWDFDNCRPQCRECQGIDNGRRKIFEARLRDEIGNERVDALAMRRDEIKQWTGDELNALIAERKEQLRNL